MLHFIKNAVAAFARINIADAVVASLIRYTMVALAAGVAALCLVASVGCAIAALWIYALPRVGPVWAPLIAAGILLVLCLTGLGIVWRVCARKRPKPAPNVSADMLVAAAERLLSERPGTVLLAALVAGLLAGLPRRERPSDPDRRRRGD